MIAIRVLFLFFVFVLSESFRNVMKTNRIVSELFAKRMSGELSNTSKKSAGKKEETAPVTIKPPTKGFGKVAEPAVQPAAVEAKKFDVIDVLTAPTVSAKAGNFLSVDVQTSKAEAAKVVVVDDAVAQATQRDEKQQAAVLQKSLTEAKTKAEQAAKEQAEREAAAVAKAKAEQEAREIKVKAEQAAKEQAEREAAAVAKAKAEQEAREIKVKAEQAAKEQAEREAAEAEAKRFKGWTPHHTTTVLK